MLGFNLKNQCNTEEKSCKSCNGVNKEEYLNLFLSHIFTKKWEFVSKIKSFATNTLIFSWYLKKLLINVYIILCATVLPFHYTKNYSHAPQLLHVLHNSGEVIYKTYIIRSSSQVI